MTSFTKKYRNIITLAGIALVSLTLSACGEFQGGPGTGGLGDLTEEAPTNQTEEAGVVVEPAAATPIPPATGKIIFTSNRDGQTDLYIFMAASLADMPQH